MRYFAPKLFVNYKMVYNVRHYYYSSELIHQNPTIHIIKACIFCLISWNVPSSVCIWSKFLHFVFKDTLAESYVACWNQGIKCIYFLNFLFQNDWFIIHSVSWLIKTNTHHFGPLLSHSSQQYHTCQRINGKNACQLLNYSTFSFKFCTLMFLYFYANRWAQNTFLLLDF